MKKVEIITNCPSCSSELERIKDQLFCRSNTCIATQAKKVSHFSKTIRIMGLGEKTIEKLGIETIPDIYEIIKNKEHINKTIGDKLADKLVQEIENSKQTNLSKILPAFSIPLIGSVAAKKLNKVVDTIDEITFDVCKKAGLGEKATSNLLQWIESTYPIFKDLPLQFEVMSQRTESETQDKNIKVCITGKLRDYRSRDLASTFLESKGITVVSGVSKSLDYLINEDNKPSSKLSKANEYNIPVVSIEKLLEEI